MHLINSFVHIDTIKACYWHNLSVFFLSSLVIAMIRNFLFSQKIIWSSLKKLTPFQKSKFSYCPNRFFYKMFNLPILEEVHAMYFV